MSAVLVKAGVNVPDNRPLMTFRQYPDQQITLRKRRTFRLTKEEIRFAQVLGPSISTGIHPQIRRHLAYKRTAIDLTSPRPRYATYTISCDDSKTNIWSTFSLQHVKATSDQYIKIGYIADLIVYPTGQSLGGQTLKVIERISQDFGVNILVGIFFPDEGKERELERFYIKHGFSIANTYVFKTYEDHPNLPTLHRAN